MAKRRPNCDEAAIPLLLASIDDPSTSSPPSQSNPGINEAQQMNAAFAQSDDDELIDADDGWVPFRPIFIISRHSQHRHNHNIPPASSLDQAHCHSLSPPKVNRAAERALVIVIVLTTVFVVGEFVGGQLADSLAIKTDAAHLLSDLLSFVISLVSIRLARRPPSTRLSFGYHRTGEEFSDF